LLIEDQTALAELALKSGVRKIREAAVGTVKNQALLAKIQRESTDPVVRRKAAENFNFKDQNLLAI